MDGAFASLRAWVDSDGHAVGDTYSGIENLTGGSSHDTLKGDANANLLDGGAGNDTLIGGAGADVLNGNTDTDTASYATAAAAIIASLIAAAGNTGEAAGDTYVGIENLTGGAFDDVLTGDAGANVIDAGAGNDTLIGGAGADALNGNAGIDTASYAVAAAAVIANLTSASGNTGDAAGDSYTAIENLVGSSFNDTLTGTTGANSLDGGAGDDTLVGGAGADTLNGNVGVDTASYAGATALVLDRVNVANSTGDAAGDAFMLVERFILTSNADQFVGNGENETIDGAARRFRPSASAAKAWRSMRLTARPEKRPAASPSTRRTSSTSPMRATTRTSTAPATPAYAVRQRLPTAILLRRDRRQRDDRAC